MRKVLIFSVIVMPLFLSACKAITPTENVKDTILFSSSAFNNLEKIPVKYTGYGDDVSPPLHWSNFPLETQSFAIVMDDPDAWPATFTHWIIFDIPLNKSGFTEEIPQDLTLQDSLKQGRNDFGNIGYNGPRPPSGQTHYYMFTIYALDKVLGIEGGVSIQGFLKAINGHILAKGTFVDLYGD